MPSEPSVLRFYIALLAALGAPLQPRRRLADVEQVSLSLLRATGVRTLVIDELHNVLAGQGNSRREFLNLLRFLGDAMRIPIIGVGTREAYLAVIWKCPRIGRTDDHPMRAGPRDRSPGGC
nr:TniB family NTP-binding protein [Cryobacterium lactosi]